MKNRKLRLYIDYRVLNKQTINDAYPLPQIDELLSCLKSAKIFSHLDLCDRYHQLLIYPPDHHKTAFSCHYGTLQFNVMIFGFCNAPSTFKWVMNNVFIELLDHTVIVYLDDNLIYSKDVESYR